MEIHYESHYRDKAQPMIETVENVVVSHALYDDNDDRRYLEKQPEALARIIGRLLDFLLEKKLMTAKEFHEIIDSRWNVREGKIKEPE